MGARGRRPFRPREAELLAQFLLADRGPAAVESGGHRPRGDARAWAELPAERRERLTTLLAGFCVAEDAVAEQLTPFADVARRTGSCLPGEPDGLGLLPPAPRRAAPRAAVRPHRRRGARAGRGHARPSGAPPPASTSRPRCSSCSRSGCRRWPRELAAGAHRAGRGRQPLPHAARGSRLRRRAARAARRPRADGALPGIRKGIERVERDERWHVGFGLRCLVETQPSAELLDDLLERAEAAAAVWGDAVPVATREKSARKVGHRLHAAGLIRTPAAA